MTVYDGFAVGYVIAARTVRTIAPLSNLRKYGYVK